jgi:hypothetical protein
VYVCCSEEGRERRRRGWERSVLAANGEQAGAVVSLGVVVGEVRELGPSLVPILACDGEWRLAAGGISPGS